MKSKVNLVCAYIQKRSSLENNLLLVFAFCIYLLLEIRINYSRRQTKKNIIFCKLCEEPNMRKFNLIHQNEMNDTYVKVLVQFGYFFIKIIFNSDFDRQCNKIHTPLLKLIDKGKNEISSGIEYEWIVAVSPKIFVFQAFLSFSEMFNFYFFFFFRKIFILITVLFCACEIRKREKNSAFEMFANVCEKMMMVIDVFNNEIIIVSLIVMFKCLIKWFVRCPKQHRTHQCHHFKNALHSCDYSSESCALFFFYNFHSFASSDGFPIKIWSILFWCSFFSFLFLLPFVFFQSATKRIVFYGVN